MKEIIAEIRPDGRLCEDRQRLRMESEDPTTPAADQTHNGMRLRPDAARSMLFSPRVPFTNDEPVPRSGETSPSEI